MLAVRARDAQSDLRAAVTALLPVVASGYDRCRDSVREAMGAAGLGGGSDRDLALTVGALESARAFVLLAESMEVEPGALWATYLSQAASAA